MPQADCYDCRRDYTAARISPARDENVCPRCAEKRAAESAKWRERLTARAAAKAAGKAAT